MATDLLNEKSIRAALKAAAGSATSRKVLDGDGLHLEARPTGAGWWRLRYRFGGKEGMLSLGTYPEVGLALARKRRKEAREQIAAGIDPSAVRKAKKVEKAQQEKVSRLVAAGLRAPGTFEAVAREWVAGVHKVKVSEPHADRTLTRFENDVFPWLGARQLAAIEPPELLMILRRIIDRGAIETAQDFASQQVDAALKFAETGVTQRPTVGVESLEVPGPLVRLAQLCESITERLVLGAQQRR